MKKHFRYVATAHPLHVKQFCTNCTLIFWVTGVWTISATFALPYAFVYRVFPMERSFNSIRRCTPMMHFSAAFKTAECMSFYFIPLVLLAVLYWRIARLLWNNTSYLHESIRQSGRVAALARIRGWLCDDDIVEAAVRMTINRFQTVVAW